MTNYGSGPDWHLDGSTFPDNLKDPLVIVYRGVRYIRESVHEQTVRERDAARHDCKSAYKRGFIDGERERAFRTPHTLDHPINRPAKMKRGGRDESTEGTARPS